jgi:hypothetical protein
MEVPVWLAPGRSDMVMKATVGNGKPPDNALARACSEELNAAKSG